MSEKEPGKGWFQQDQQRRQRPWGGNEPVFQEVQGETKVLAGEHGQRGAWVQGSVGAREVRKHIGLGHSLPHGPQERYIVVRDDQGRSGAQAGFNLQIRGSRAG